MAAFFTAVALSSLTSVLAMRAFGGADIDGSFEQEIFGLMIGIAVVTPFVAVAGGLALLVERLMPRNVGKSKFLTFAAVTGGTLAFVLVTAFLEGFVLWHIVPLGAVAGFTAGVIWWRMVRSKELV